MIRLHHIIYLGLFLYSVTCLATIHADSPKAPVAPPKPAPAAPVVPEDLSPSIQTPLPGVKLTLLVEHPDIVTPTGIGIAADGSIYTISSHTHQRPQGYTGPQHDEILVFDAFGKNRRVFYNRTTMTMQLLHGRDGWVYLTERGRILRIKDTDGDGVADKEETLASLDTVSDYPHNGLSGMAWHPDGDLIFSLGENFGNNWTLTSVDGSKESGRGEGGVFRCSADGKNMRRIARGFWNPFGIHVNRYGEIFTADNDPGSRPPCRLLEVVEGADYGFQWVYGSSPIHPFVAWNGELRGTLGMIHSSCEGPCAVLELGGGVLVPSWSDHRIDYYPLHRKGASYQSERITIVEGNEFFRPTVAAKGPDGAFYVNDWVFSSYPVHQRGRLWKLEIDPGVADWMKKDIDEPNDASRLADGLRSGKVEMEEGQLFDLTLSDDHYIADAALTALARIGNSWTPESLRALPIEKRITAFVALRRNGLGESKWIRALIDDPDPEIQFECLRWIADGVLTEFTAHVEKTLSDPKLNFRLFEAGLATSNTLRGEPGAGVTNPTLLIEKILDPETPLRIKSYSLRLAPPKAKGLTVPVLMDLFGKDDPLLSEEVVHALTAQDSDVAKKALADIAENSTHDAKLRADAIDGLAASTMPEHHALFLRLATDANSPAIVRDEALRALRGVALDDAQKNALTDLAQHDSGAKELVDAALNPALLAADRPAYTDTAAWLALLDNAPGKPDLETGRRLFFHPRLALCATCHRNDGRGIVLGPDLSLIGRQGTREAILHSILDPQAEVAPQFFPSQVKLTNGDEFIAILLRSSNVDVFRSLTGQEFNHPETEIASRTELQTSLMPTGLPANLTIREFRDLLAFLMASEKE